MTSHGLLLIAHGSKDPEWAAPFKAIEAAIAREFPGPVVLAYLESTAPGIDVGLAMLTHQGVSQITVAPLFFALGSHVRSDIPKFVVEARAQHPEIAFEVLPAIGLLPSIQDLIAREVTAQVRLQANSPEDQRIGARQ